MTSPPQPSDALSAPERAWADALAALAIPDEILAAAPVSPHAFDVSLFRRAAAQAEEEETPSQRVAREALPLGGSVLDVGCGGGAGAMPLVPPAGRVVGVDEGAGMLEAFAERAEERGAAHAEIQGRWPDVAGQAPTADVVVCHNVFYNVPDIGPFARALTDHARTRVVVELGEEHPLAWMAPYWKHVHGLDRPSRPTADDAITAVRSLGYDVAAERWARSWRSERSEEELVAQVRRRLCLGPERDEQIAGLVRRYPPPSPRPLVTLWWAPPVA
ncbi:MAG: methyltransferase domain-containing protein [Egibacteraceae bacterium]